MRKFNFLFHVMLGAVIFGSPASSFAAALDVNSVAGVYKYHFKNGNVDGGKYESENILEIVPVSSTGAYFKISLDFFNGHVCNLWGVADVEQGDLVYYSLPDEYSQKVCVFRIHASEDKLTFSDKDGICRESSCGARGEYDGISFRRGSKRTIRYMKRLTASQDYKDALKAHGNHSSGPAQQ